MDWSKFNNHGESNNHAFEVMCNLLFESWCKSTYGQQLKHFAFVNGAGGDGGVEAFSVLLSGEVVAVQSKWFKDCIGDTQINEIQNSLTTAVTVRPNISTYIVCIPRDLGSQKIGRGKKVVKNTEAGRWNEFIEKNKKTYPAIEVILWDETHIQEKLIQPESQGIYKYWFNNTLIFDDNFITSIDKAKCSWAKTKYIPEVYTEGYIHDRLEYFLGSIQLTNRRCKELDSFIERLIALKRSCEDLLSLGFPEKEHDLEEKIKTDIPTINDWIMFLREVRQLVENGEEFDFTDKKFELSCHSHDIKDSSLHFGQYFHFHEVETLLEDIEDDFYDMQRLLSGTDDNRIIFLGNQGTGKTAGIVAEVSTMLKTGEHLPVLVHAKEYSDGDTWTSIIVKALGLSQEWEEKELFGSLQSAASLKNSSLMRGVDSKCVICVDGIDEAQSFEFWKLKIDEARVFADDFHKIRFVFLSRPYVFENRYELTYRNCFYSLPENGDVEVKSLCEKYFEIYNIEIGDNTWIKSFLRTPYSVRIFCDIYGNRKLEGLAKNTVVITNLFQRKIEALETDYKARNKQVCEGIIKVALHEIADLFVKNDVLTFDKLYEGVSSQLKNDLAPIIEFLSEEGFIYSYVKQEDEFSTPKTVYSWGMQPAFDYLIAQKLYKRLSSCETIKVPYTNGIYQMLSLIAIENGKLIVEYENIEIENDSMFELICYAFANCSLEAASKYPAYLKGLMEYSITEFHEIVNRVIIPNINITDHPLGVKLLDEFLRGFDSPAERDIWWSIPAYLRDNYNADWRAYSEINIGDIELPAESGSQGAALVLVWSLSSVNNETRQQSRFKLTKWGIENPLKYWKILVDFCEVNDEQILEDVFAVAYGIALSQFVDNDYILVASKWILENVFSEAGLKTYENVVIRYYGSSIVKIAIAKNLLDEKIIDMVTPPYTYDEEIMPLFSGAVDSERNGGYQAIDYDLARYVLCDRFDGYFRIDHKTNRLVDVSEKFIEKYRIANNLSKLKMDGLIISVAYQYLLNQGWSEEIFWSFEDNKCGVDAAIRRTHYHATHGAMSRIMTVSEKEVWLAKHRIEAMLANMIPYSEDYRSLYFINDYSKLENFINTYQDYANAEKRDTRHNWRNIELLANPGFCSIVSNEIEKWMIEDYLPDFGKWLCNGDGNILLSTFTNVQNNISGVEEAIWVSTGVVDADDFATVITQLDGYFENRSDLINVSNFVTYQDCHCYCTPQEACLVHSGREVEDECEIPYEDRMIVLHKLVLECLSADELETEKRFSLPSYIARDLTGIVYGDGYDYCDKEGNVIARFSTGGEAWQTQQSTLVINENILKRGLDSAKYKIFWLFRNYREPSSKARERFQSLLHDTDRTFIVWQDKDNEFRYKELFEVRPPAKDNIIYDSDEVINQILSMYSFPEEDD